VGNKSPYALAKDLEGQVSRSLRSIEHSKLDSRQRDMIASLNQNLSDVRTYAKDYELSETRLEQEKNAKLAKKYLNRSQKEILAISQFGVFNPVDVAQLSAMIGLISGGLA